MTTTATRSTDRLTGRSWLEFDQRPGGDVIANLKRLGWRWSGYRKAWHHPSRHAIVPDGVSVEDGGQVSYSEERAGRLEDRAESHQAKADAARGRADAIADMIPMGQPILVGHHSEGRHRRDLDRITRGMRTSIEEGATADRLNDAAESSRRHQAYIQSAPVMKRRLQKLDADLRARARNVVTWTAEGHPEWAGPAYTGRTAELQAERDELAAQIAAMGGTASDRLVVEVGDVIRCKGHLCLVKRVNPKTYSVVLVGGPCAGWKFTYDHSWLQEIVRKHDAPSEEKPA